MLDIPYYITVVFLFIVRCRFPKSKSLADIVRSRYGTGVLRQTRRYEKLDYRLRKSMLDVEFLESCLESNVVPRFLKFKLANPRLRHSNAYNECQRNLLNTEIRLKNKNRNRLHLELLRIGEDIKKVLSFFDWTHIAHLSITCNISRINKVKYVQDYKLAELIADNIKHDPDDVIMNFSSYQLNGIEKSLLTKGLNFAIPPKKLKFEDYLLPFELLFRGTSVHNLSDLSLLHLKSGIRDLALSTYRVYNKKDHRYENLTSDEVEAFVILANNSDIIIQKADKGNTVVLIDRTVYVQKMEEILGDESKFQKIQFNPKHKVNKEVRYMLDLETKIKSCLDDLLDGGYLSNEDYKFMKPVGSRPGVMYGLCKVHKGKEGLSPPFRPILSAIGTSAYKIAKFLVPILKSCTVNEHSVIDSFSFVDDVIKQNAGLHMATFDVKSLFTNVPLNETIDICINKLFHNKRKVNGLLKRHFKELLSLATKSSCFIFNGNYFCQVDGVAMGSPLGPTLANLFLCHYESIWLDNCPIKFRPVYYKRYVDDVFMMFNDKGDVNKFLRYLNSRHTNIEFSKDEERDDKISFLDVNITREKGKLVTSIYRKDTFSGVYSNYNSFLPREYKRGLLNTLLYRAYMISSSYFKLHEEISRLKDIMIKNSFPLHIIDNSVRKFLNSLFIKRACDKITTDKKEVTMILPFLGVTSIQLKNRLNKLFRSCCPNIKLNVIFSAANRLSSGFRYKDKIPNDMRSFVLYKYKCGFCINSYVGKTKRHYIVRRYEHLGFSVFTDKSLKYTRDAATAIRKHIIDDNHQCDLENFKIVGASSNDFHLRIKESLLILKEKPHLNVANESLPLHVFH